MSHTEFSEEQFLSIYPQGIERHYWTLARNQIIQKVLQKQGFEKKRLLEIGAGKGVVVQFLRDCGFDCFGADLSHVPVTEDLKSVLFTGIDFVDLPEDFRNSIQVVMLFDVIEHISDPVVFLNQIKTSFPHAKQCIITVPARQELWSNYDVFNGHFRRYSRESLSSLFSQLGWSVKRIQYLFHALYIPARLLLRSKGKRNTVIHAPRGIMISIHKILAFLMVIDYRLFPKKLLGSSLLSVVTMNK